MANDYHSMKLKPKITAEQLLEISQNSYIDTIYEIFNKNINEALLEFEAEAEDKVKECSLEDRLKVVRIVSSEIDQYVENEVAGLEEYANDAIFIIPNNVKLPEDQLVEQNLINYSQEEEHKLDKRINELSELIKKKQNYLLLLKNKTELLANAKKHFQAKNQSIKL